MSASSDSESEKDVELDCFVEVYSHSKYSDPLPFPDVSPDWYDSMPWKFIMPQESNVEVHMLQW